MADTMSMYDGDERCCWERCPGYPEDDEQPMLQHEDGEWHSECADEAGAEEARFWARQWTAGGAGPAHHPPSREPERVDSVLDAVFGRADVRRGER